jgi:hypothetical protein
MAVVTPFGDLTLTDKVALERWIAAHDARHQVYPKQNLPSQPPLPTGPLGNRNAAPKAGTLRGPIDGDWMLRHTARHATLATAHKELLASGNRNTTPLRVQALALPSIWKSEQEMQDWHLLHNRLHSLLDKVTDVRQVRAHHGR